MTQTLPEGSFILPADMLRIEAALAELKNTNDAHATLDVKVNLHVHYEYPKHVQVGENTVIVNSKAEEAAALAAPPSEPTTEIKPFADTQDAAGETGVVFSNANLDPPYLVEMSKAERKEELGGMSKAELTDLAGQHDVAVTSGMNKTEITSAINKQLNKEAKTGTE